MDPLALSLHDYRRQERRTLRLLRRARAGDDAGADRSARRKKNFVILNRYPYTSGHVMVVPYAQWPFAAFDPDTLTEMMQLAKRIQAAQEVIYHPDGYNLGMNVGRAAGAGIADHLHLHLLPRWIGDTNFMTTIAETASPRGTRRDLARLHRALEMPPALAPGPPPATVAGENQR